MKWQAELPNAPGDWLWVTLWGCECCVRAAGIANIHELESESDGPRESEFSFAGQHGERYVINWESQTRPYFEGDIPKPTAWAKIDLPKITP